MGSPMSGTLQYGRADPRKRRCLAGKAVDRPRARALNSLSCVVAILACACLPASVSAETIRGALAKTYVNNPELDEQRAVVRVHDEEVPKAAAGWRPKASISINGGPQRTYIKAPAGFDQFRSRSYSQDEYSGLPRNGTFNFQQPIFDGWKTTNSVRQAESMVEASRQALRQTEQEILEKGATAYMNALRDAAVANLRKKNIEVLRIQLRVTRDRNEFGDVTQTDVAQATAALAQAQADSAAADGALQNSLAVYRQVVGEEPRKLEPATPLESILPRSQEEAITLAFADHPSLLEAEHEISAAEAAVKVAESQLLPTASVGAQVIQQYDSYFGYPGTRQFGAQLVGQLNVPLYQGGAEYSSIRQAREQLGRARIHATVLRNAVRASVVQAFSQFATAKASKSFNEKAVKAAEIALRGVRDEAAFGQRTTLDVLNAQQALLNARVNLVTSQRDLVVGSYTLLGALGHLSVNELNLDVVPYRPTSHFDQVKDKWVGISAPDYIAVKAGESAAAPGK